MVSAVRSKRCSIFQLTVNFVVYRKSELRMLEIELLYSSKVLMEGKLLRASTGTDVNWLCLQSIDRVMGSNWA